MHAHPSSPSLVVTSSLELNLMRTWSFVHAFVGLLSFPYPCLGKGGTGTSDGAQSMFVSESACHVGPSQVFTSGAPSYKRDPSRPRRTIEQIINQ